MVAQAKNRRQIDSLYHEYACLTVGEQMAQHVHKKNDRSLAVPGSDVRKQAVGPVPPYHAKDTLVKTDVWPQRRAADRKDKQRHH